MAEHIGFEEFYAGTRHRLITYLYAMTGDRAQAQDAAQEAYDRAWQRWSTVSGYDDPEAWVRTVAHRLCMNHWRKARNRVTAYLRHGTGRDADPPGENTVALITALKRLSVAERQAIAMHHLMDLSVAEVAAQTGIPVNTIKTRLARGRRALAGLLDEDASEEYAHA
ncbi:sigma-70 family RNA polymerase sigma factor [Couchioplanes caeruleus]|uniref:RNA polymerase subunit sigma-24 n=2 Tax=Couchioplanes caeruleus TaxID=56438 RepID=A0A1K0FE14_9ACTN|nr:sigma-70 family RNA polymerase sigma factor [Couchioplanes caeruleus]OJF10976.1 RNA polymerase subunit sigma-24 [Couchioplanes caeruleus subsp. caeruleus]ROP30828.1 RNA polymerase sigma-70 factor (ECF subfamily) [Couchioplanes caeruleus]